MKQLYELHGVDRRCVTTKFTRYLSLQMKEINEHKYYLSEKYGYDVGYDNAIQDWSESKYAKQFHDNYAEHIKTIDVICNETCECKCKGVNNCCLSINIVHQLMGDK